MRDNMPEAFVVSLADSNLNYEDMRLALRAYLSDEIPTGIVRLSVENNKMNVVRQAYATVEENRNNFFDALLRFDLFRNTKVYELMQTNEVLYLRHEFNWKTYESRLVLYGENGRATFPMSQLPLIGGCWSNHVAQRMLNGQIFLKYVFDTAKASLANLAESHQWDCKIVACDNCFYAPFLFFYRDANGNLADGCEEEREKVYMYYLIGVYPKAHQWIISHSEEESFYNDFYTKYTPEH